MIEELAELTGGRAFFPDSVYELEDICTKIAVELKNQYVIGYHTTNGAKDGKWRKLRREGQSAKRHPAPERALEAGILRADRRCRPDEQGLTSDHRITVNAMLRKSIFGLAFSSIFFALLAQDRAQPQKQEQGQGLHPQRRDA